MHKGCSPALLHLSRANADAWPQRPQLRGQPHWRLLRVEITPLPKAWSFLGEATKNFLVSRHDNLCLLPLWNNTEGSSKHQNAMVGWSLRRADIRGHFSPPYHLSFPSHHWGDLRNTLHMGFWPLFPSQGLLCWKPNQHIFCCPAWNAFSCCLKNCVMWLLQVSFWQPKTCFFVFTSAHSLHKPKPTIALLAGVRQRLLIFTQAGLLAIVRQGEYQDTHLRTMNHHLEQKS